MNYQASPHLIRFFDFDLLHMELNTPLYTLALVLVVMFLMNKLLFRPVLQTLANRAKLMQSLQNAAVGHREQMDRLNQDYESRLAEVRAEVARVRAESGRETQREVNAILEQAHKEAQADFESALADLQQQVEAAKRELSAASQRLAEQTTNRILHV